MFELDHIAVAGETLTAAAQHTEQSLGIAPGPGGQHTHYGTHNQLLGLADGLYLEAIAIDPSQPEPPYPRWFGLDDFKGPARLDKWILRCDDINAALQQFPDLGDSVHLTRGSVSWTMIVPPDGRLPFDGLFPALIQWHTDSPPGKALPAARLELQWLTVACPAAEELSSLLGPVFSDTRVVFESAETPSLEAVFDTPDGQKVLR